MLHNDVIGHLMRHFSMENHYKLIVSNKLTMRKSNLKTFEIVNFNDNT